MSNRIFEETPSVGNNAPGKNSLEKQASQLAYDTKYKVKKTLGKHTNLNPAQVSKAYLSQLAKSPAPGAVKALAKKKLIGDGPATPKVSNEEYIGNINDVVQESLIDALTKVFVEGVQNEEKEDTEYIEELYSKTNKKGERLYHIKVTDKQTGNTYTRDATRAKIAELRANPNISSVEMTEYNRDSEGEKTKGEKTAAVKSGKGLKNDGNLANNYPPYDKVTRGDVIAGATGKDQMGGKKKVKEEFIGEVKDQSDKKITGKGVNNYKGKDKVVKLNPEISEQMKPDEDTQKPQQQNTSDTNQKKQLSTLQQFQRKEEQLNRQKLAALKSKKIPVGSVQMDSYEPDGDQIDEKITAKTDMGTAIKDFYASKSPQLAGRTKEERRKAAIAAVLTARRGGSKLGEENCDCEDDEPKLKKNEGGVEDPREIPTKVNLAKNKLRAMGLKMSYEPEGEVIDERRKEDKVAGTPRKPRNRAFELVAKSMGAGRMGVQPRGKKKVPGQKPPAAGEYGSGVKSPAQKVAQRRAAAQRAQDNMSSRFD